MLPSEYIRQHLDEIKEILSKDLIIRYHTDADGIGSALILNEIVKNEKNNHVFTPLRFASYTKNQAEYDLSLMHPRENHSLVLTDVGTGVDTCESIDMIKSHGIKTLHIDHHPVKKKCNYDVDVNPWLFLSEENPSRYTAGYLAGLLAKEMSIWNEKIELLMEIAVFGDTSDIIDVSEKGRKMSIIFDILSGKKVYDLNVYNRILASEEYYKEMWTETSELIDKIERVGGEISKIKSTKTATIITVNLDIVYEKTGFPARGRILDIIFNNAKNKYGCIVAVGYANTGIMLRISPCVPNSIRAEPEKDTIIKRVIDEMGHFMKSYGGHPYAFSIQSIGGESKRIANRITRLIYEELSSP